MELTIDVGQFIAVIIVTIVLTEVVSFLWRKARPTRYRRRD